MTTTIKRVGGSLAVIVPRGIAAEANLTEGSTMSINATTDGILLKHVGRRARRPIAQLARQIKPASYARRTAELRADSPVGKEAR